MQAAFLAQMGRQNQPLYAALNPPPAQFTQYPAQRSPTAAELSFRQEAQDDGLQSQTPFFN